MKYVVTGGAGFIGSHLIEKLVGKGHNVLCIDDLSSGFRSNIPSDEKNELLFKPVQDVDFERVKEYDGIFHLAAQASVPKSIGDFFNSSKNNLLATLKVWDWAIKFKIPVVYASSSAIYGNLPVGDDQIADFDILSPYAQDKLTMEDYAKMAWKVYHTKSIGLRFFNVYGPKQDPKNPYSGVISIFIDRLINKMPVTLNGGYQTRDFVFVGDIADCLVESMNKLHNNDLCEAFNVGSGVSITISKLLDQLIEMSGYKPEIIHNKLPEGDPERSGGTYEKLQNILGVKINTFVPFETGLRKTFDYFTNYE